jgi:predicted O-methyltransferase YrrM
MYDEKKSKDAKVLEYVYKVGNKISEGKFNLIKETEELFGDDSHMLTNQAEGELLNMLVKLSGAKKGIEIGVFTGYSALCLAEAIGPNGKLIAFDISEKFTDLAKKHWKLNGVDDRIELIIGNALETLKGFEKDVGTFDFAYVDADKDNYINYYEILFPLLKQGGFIVFDNTLWRHKVADEANNEEITVALRKLNKLLRDDNRVEINMLDLSDGVTIVRKI